jgi:hypothetical protein
VTRNEEIPYLGLLRGKGQVTIEVTMKESTDDEANMKALAKGVFSRL